MHTLKVSITPTVYVHIYVKSRYYKHSILQTLGITNTRYYKHSILQTLDITNTRYYKQTAIRLSRDHDHQAIPLM